MEGYDLCDSDIIIKLKFNNVGKCYFSHINKMVYIPFFFLLFLSPILSYSIYNRVNKCSIPKKKKKKERDIVIIRRKACCSHANFSCADESNSRQSYYDVVVEFDGRYKCGF